MIGRDFSDIYVAACGEPFDTRKQGVEHERRCGECQFQISLGEDAGDREREERATDEYEAEQATED